MTYHFLAWQSHRFDRHLVKTMALGNEQSCSVEIIITNYTFTQKNISLSYKFRLPFKKIFTGLLGSHISFHQKITENMGQKAKVENNNSKIFL